MNMIFKTFCAKCSRGALGLLVQNIQNNRTKLKWFATVSLGTGLVGYQMFSHPVLMSNTYADAKKFMAEPITNPNLLEENAPHDIRAKVELMIMRIQKEFCDALEKEENDKETKFTVDKWLKEDGGGGGITCVLQEGMVFEKAAVNTYVVNGILPEEAVVQFKNRGKKFASGPVKFFAASIISVIHPRNPMVPTLHFNYRYIEIVESDGVKTWWFGGGTDLTPYYVDKEDFIHFHSKLKEACDKHNPEYYPTFKKWCDSYFLIKHRNETRGIGGIYFEDLNGPSNIKAFNFVESCLNAVIPSYIPLVQKHKDDAYGYSERQWQLLRRGRYVEFNLLYDKGTKFNLNSSEASYESILVSLPLNAKWEYMHKTSPDSKEGKLMSILQNPIDWAQLQVN